MACKQYRKGKIGIATKYPNNTLTSFPPPTPILSCSLSA